jgi:hypothetical protein
VEEEDLERVGMEDVDLRKKKNVLSKFRGR